MYGHVGSVERVESCDTLTNLQIWFLVSNTPKDRIVGVCVFFCIHDSANAGDMHDTYNCKTPRYFSGKGYRN